MHQLYADVALPSYPALARRELSQLASSPQLHTSLFLANNRATMNRVAVLVTCSAQMFFGSRFWVLLPCSERFSSL